MNKGFTLIELMLSMAFVAMLMVAVAMTVIQIANIYSKGLTLKEVNQSGQALTQDMQSVIGSSQPLQIADGGGDYKILNAVDGKAAGARLCTGSYSYIWNLGGYISRPANVYESGDALIRFVKVDDRGKSYCNDTSKKIVIADATELLPEGDRNLAVQSLAIGQVAGDAVLQQALYRITLELGTNDRDILQTETIGSGSIATVDTSCKPPNADVSQESYCAVNKFEITARAGNRGEI